MDKLIWSNTMTQDMLLGLDEESLKTELEGWGYEPDMIEGMDKQELDDLVLSDDNMWHHDAVYFEDDIKPVIDSQTLDGIVLLSGTAGSWTGNHGAGKAVRSDELINGRICQDCDTIKLIDEDGNLIWSASHHDGTHYMGLYAIPEDEEKRKEFVRVCMPEAVEDAMDYGDPDFESNVNGMIEVLDEDLINEWCDFSKVPEVCEPIKAPATSVETESVDEPLEEAKSKDPEQLEYEIAEIEADYEDFGPEGFYAVPFTSFERQFPEFTKTCVRKFLEELEILSKEELEDTDLLNEYWKNGELIIPEDWPCLIDGAKRLTSTRKDKGVQWQKIWAVYSNTDH